MRRELTDQAEAMAGQRVRQLGEELRSAGLLPPEDDDDRLPITVVRSPGRHSRGLQDGAVLPRSIEWVRERIGERVPFAASHLTVLAVIAALVLVGVAWLRISASSEAVPVPRARTTVASATPSASGASASAGAEVVVDVAGKVHHPGVISLPPGSRVIDAIRRAGGATGGADLTSLNLARVLVDGEQILVGAPAALTSSTSIAPGSTSGGASGGQVSLNQATLEQLETLPGVGPATAQKILDYRTTHGAFGSVDELLDVDGIGEKTLARLAPHLTL